MKLAAIATCALWIGAFAANAQTVSEQYLLAAANRERVSAGLSPVQVDPLLAQAAEVHAREMAARGSISHQFSGEPDLVSRAGAAGVRFSLITENVAAAPSSLQIHDLWMKSAGHRANLLDPAVTAVGLAVVSKHGQLFAVEDFARTVEHLSVSEQETAVAALLVRQGVSIANDAGDARQTCLRASGYAGVRQPWFVMRFTGASLDHLPEQLTTRLLTGKYHEAAVGACFQADGSPFTTYRIAVLLFP